MGTDIVAAAKSYWDKPEVQKTGRSFLGLGAIGLGLVAAMNWNAIMVWLATTLENTLYTAGLIALTCFLGWAVFTENRLKTAARTLFSMAMYWLTNAMIAIDPISILKNTIREAKGDREDFGTQRDNLGGVKEGIEGTMEENADNIKRLLRLADRAEHEGKISQRDLHLMNVGRDRESNEIYQRSLDEINEILKNFDEIQEALDFEIGNMEGELRTAKQRHEIATSLGRGIRSAWRILRHNDRTALRNETLEYVANNYREKIGQFKSLKAGSQRLIDRVALEKGVMADEGKRMLEEWRTGIKAIKGAKAEVKALPPGKPVASIQPVDRVDSRERVVLPRTDPREFDKLIDKK